MRLLLGGKVFVLLTLVGMSVVPLAVQAQETKGIVSITFDDALASQHANGLRIAQQYGIVGTLFVGTEGVETAQTPGNAWAMTWEQVQDFVDAGWEIGSHSHTHPQMPELNPSEVRFELDQSYQLINQKLGITPVSYASPFGDFDEMVLDAVMDRYQYHLRGWGGNEGRNPVGATEPSLIGRLDVSNQTSVETVCQEMRQASIDGTWLVLIFHRIVEGEPAEYEVSVDSFEEMMSCAQDLQKRDMVEVTTIQVAMELNQ